ncbi:GNAT family N-acetyltransferase [Paenibacillus sp. B01]|uniref:GNAT family N-acetyltransferase n=1 Tax=Paenibacillus sp. B01 TaxID=2660554 RepID=UPI00129AA77D|nr:GNAT family N-acetyltransferase [Paenibacillus sp. B01]QGG55513.1 GNAT family N-acetyltransferase [Paenibacillus sp. B01]
MIEITRAGAGQAKELAPLFHRYRVFYGHPDQETELALAEAFLDDRLRRGESAVFAALADGAAVGFMQLYPVFSSISLKRAWILNDLFVDPAWRGRGVARRLLREAERLGMETGAAYIQLSTAYGNAAARSLYESEGYEEERQFAVYERIIGKQPLDPPAGRDGAAAKEDGT